jgi:hypothetical protein
MTFGGILHIPEHKFADMHGLLRAVVAVKHRLSVRSVIEANTGSRLPPSVWLLEFWAESKSQIERSIAEDQPGKVFLVRLDQAYLFAHCYERFPAIRTKTKYQNETVKRGIKTNATV